MDDGEDGAALFLLTATTTNIAVMAQAKSNDALFTDSVAWVRICYMLCEQGRSLRSMGAMERLCSAS